MTRPAVLISTTPFGEADQAALDVLVAAGVECMFNPLGRRFTEAELADRIGTAAVLVAGTEPITRRVLEGADRLRLICRVGVGLDNVDLAAARERGVLVSYTPEAPAPAVAELTVGLMLALLREVHVADRLVRRGAWSRRMGRRLGEATVGVIGTGRIGKRVAALVRAFGARVLANDLVPDPAWGAAAGVDWVDKDALYRLSDIVTLHVPLTPQTRRLITSRELDRMKPEAVLINTARGGVVDEGDLASALHAGRLAGAALDVFEREPYQGELATVDACLLTCHMGSMSRDCRARMEREAAEEAVRFLRGEPLRSPVPEEEVAVAMASAPPSPLAGTSVR